MTTFTLSELGCNGDCHQGRDPCTCSRGVGMTYNADKGEAEVHHIPFLGTISLTADATNGQSSIEVKKTWEF